MKFAKYRTLVVNRLIFSFANYFLREQNNHIFFCPFKLVLNINYCHFCNKEKCNCKVSAFKYFRTDAKHERRYGSYKKDTEHVKDFATEIKKDTKDIKEDTESLKKNIEIIKKGQKDLKETQQNFGKQLT